MLPKRRLTLEQCIVIIRYSVIPIASWPLPAGSSASEIRLRNIWWWVALTHVSVASLGWAWGLYANLNDFDFSIKVSAELCVVFCVIWKMLICKREAPRLQGLLDEMEMVLKTGTPEELDWIYRYYDQRFSAHAIMFIGTILAPVAFICGPAVLSQPLPGASAFPFSIEPTWIWASLYILQTAAIVQVGSMATVDFMYTVLLWFIGARFELLSTEFLKARNEDDFRRCSSKHQVLIDYFNRLSRTTAPMVGLLFFVITFNVSTGGLVLVRVSSLFGSFLYVYFTSDEVLCRLIFLLLANGTAVQNPPFFVAAKFVLFVVISAVQLFIFAWPADNLIDLSVKLRDSAYGCAWIGNSRKMVRDLIIVLQRSQRPLIITMEGIVPILSLEFFGGTIAASFSYLTTLRAMADKL